MTEPVFLFVYGTLLIDEVWKRLIGRVPPIVPAYAKGFHRYRVEGAHYPGLWYTHTSTTVVGGCVQLSKKEQDTIDVYEGDEYTREVIVVHCKNEEVAAYVYLRPPRSEEEWNLHYHAPSKTL